MEEWEEKENGTKGGEERKGQSEEGGMERGREKRAEIVAESWKVRKNSEAKEKR